MKTYILLTGSQRQELLELLLPDHDHCTSFVSLEKLLPVEYYSYLPDEDPFFRYEISDKKKWLVMKLKFGLSFKEHEIIEDR